ncbi:DUF2628 domain-containing protein [Pseudomonas sp. RIT412]|nr:DUF2628 domain-containing protein [Pseudomonas sp. RIT 409]RAU55914.1 DUF2628 domain-containing protein [Pseudomonas sp. RIT 412]
MNFNFIAFFFGIIYFFVLGLWRRNLSMVGIIVVVYLAIGFGSVILDIEISASFNRGLACGIYAWYACTANIAYYLKEIKGNNGWYPFKLQL